MSEKRGEEAREEAREEGEEEATEEAREEARHAEPRPEEEEGEEEAGRSGTEEAETQADLHEDTEQLEEPLKTATCGTSAGTDVLEAAEEAEARADLQLREPEGNDSVGNSTATVKVVLVPEGHVMTVAFAIGLSIQELKRHLASELRVPAEVLQISLDGREVEEQLSLMELGVRPHGSTRMEMSSTDPGAHPLHLLRPPEHDNMPDVITVRVQKDGGEFQEVVVEIERPRQQKAFLGGYRHRLTEVEFHHAAVQTLPKRRPDRGAAVFSRDTQTVEEKSQVQQCPVSVSTQMTTNGCFVSCLSDKLVAPGNYITAEEHHGRRLRAVIRLQSFARRWLAQQAVDQLRRERNRRMAWLEMQERRRKEEREEQLKDRRRRWLNPQKREDFNLLYQALEKWRCEEEQRINASLRGADRKAALCSLLEQETQLIADIGQHRIAVHNDNYDKAVRKFLDKSAAPHRWRATDGRPIEMDTQHTIRARELRDLYNNVSAFDVSREQRLDVLTGLKRTVKEQKCQLTQEILDLIDREEDLMARGLKASNLEGLRRRISTLFLQYIRIPAFNPEVAKLLKNSSQLRNNMFLCRGCNRYLHSEKFSSSASADHRGQCRDCSRLSNIARLRQDFSCYKTILRRLRADEQQLNQHAKIPFLLQVEDMQYLVKVIWASSSALNASTDIYDLVFVRWLRQKDWSPWNCILLSKEETSAHMEVEDVTKVYKASFISRIEHKHTLARRHFSQVSVMAEHLDSGPPAGLSDQLVSRPVAMATRQVCG